ncbi:putative phosphosugar isomerase [Colletotrichum sidae]|uniref:Putative phosphosugar isomerase n=1 Tax=Colletotrichum sidae TaxID=1347389 RepID=A0A4R8T3V2_9PEZI|nr:putative phosphosugar isomerase [Colletotrichum sidae]
MVPPRSGSAMGMRSRGPVELNVNLAKSYEIRGPKSPMPRSPLRDVTADDRGTSTGTGTGSGRSASYEDRLEGAIHVLRTEANALAALTQLYSSERVCRDGFHRAIDALTRHRDHRGKVVFIGVGKSGWIAKKLTATFSSLGLPAVFLHPTEALHGDLGVVGDHDTLVMITFSGRTPELMLLLPHLNRNCPLILLTSPVRMDACDIARARPDLILLPAPIPVPERESFGVSAPTTSTTMAIAVGDALAYVASREMYPSVPSVFAKNHPGGAIGQAFKTK